MFQLESRCNRAAPNQPSRRAGRLTPVRTALAAWRLFRLRFAWWQWAGVAVALDGVAIVISHGDFAALVHDGISAGGALLMVVYTLVGRAMMCGPGALWPLATTAYAAAVGLLPLAALAVRELAQVPSLDLGWSDVAAIACLGLPGTALAYVWFYEGVKVIGAARASVFGNLVPVFGGALAVLLLGEPLLASMLVGGLVTLADVSLTDLERR
jgi:drug/metabolite transporter (DMT)-like permease